jgi:hypothetical protein
MGCRVPVPPRVRAQHGAVDPADLHPGQLPRPPRGSAWPATLPARPPVLGQPPAHPAAGHSPAPGPHPPPGAHRTRSALRGESAALQCRVLELTASLPPSDSCVCTMSPSATRRGRTGCRTASGQCTSPARVVTDRRARDPGPHRPAGWRFGGLRPGNREQGHQRSPHVGLGAQRCRGSVSSGRLTSGEGASVRAEAGHDVIMLTAPASRYRVGTPPWR